jgi:hypothetical protein
LSTAAVGSGVALRAGPVAAGRKKRQAATRQQGEIAQVVHRDERGGVEYDAVPLPTHEVTDAERAALPTAEPKRRPMTPVARAAVGRRMKASWAKRKKAQRRAARRS